MLDRIDGPFSLVADVWLPAVEGVETVASGVGFNFASVGTPFLSSVFRQRSAKTTSAKAGLYYLNRDRNMADLIEALSLRALTQAQLTKCPGALPTKYVPTGTAVFVPILIDKQWHLTKLVRRRSSFSCDLTLEDEKKSFQACDRLLFLFLPTA